MPRVVDRAERRRELGEATWRVIRRDGLERASVRTVAREAGVSVGSLRHYFETQSELLAFSMRLVAERVTERVVERVGALELAGDPRHRILAVIGELLPLDDERRAEGEVWLAFTGRALVDPDLRVLNEEVYGGLHNVFGLLVDVLIRRGPAVSGLDAQVEAERLYALVDGLAVHAVTQPSQMPPERLSKVVAHHLDSLCYSP